MSCWWSNFLLLRTRPCRTRQLGTQKSYQSVEIGLTVAASLTGGECCNCVAAGLRLVGCCLTGVFVVLGWGDVLSTVTILPIYPLDDSTWIWKMSDCCLLQIFGRSWYCLLRLRCLGRFLGITGWYPSVSKSDWLHVGISGFFFNKLGCIL